MSTRFTAMPSRMQLTQSVFLCFLTLSLVLGVMSLFNERFSPFRLILDLYTTLPWRVGGVLGIIHNGALIGFGAMWLASRRLRNRYWGLSIFIFALELFLAALPR